MIKMPKDYKGCRNCEHQPAPLLMCDRGIVHKDREVIVKRILYTDGTTNAVLMGELVRCKDCKYWTGRKYNIHINGFLPWCRFSALQREANDFCSYGERKEDRSHEQRGEKAQTSTGTGAPETEDQGSGAQL